MDGQAGDGSRGSERERMNQIAFHLASIVLVGRWAFDATAGESIDKQIPLAWHFGRCYQALCAF
jgi:hypothetical protein